MKWQLVNKWIIHFSNTANWKLNRATLSGGRGLSLGTHRQLANYRLNGLSVRPTVRQMKITPANAHIYLLTFWSSFPLLYICRGNRLLIFIPSSTKRSSLVCVCVCVCYYLLSWAVGRRVMTHMIPYTAWSSACFSGNICIHKTKLFNHCNVVSSGIIMYNNNSLIKQMF